MFPSAAPGRTFRMAVTLLATRLSTKAKSRISSAEGDWVVAAAGLVGTFKTLRKTSGTQAEILTGRGHEHLANTRGIFEKHYLDRRRVHREPVRLPRIEPPKP